MENLSHKMPHAGPYSFVKGSFICRLLRAPACPVAPWSVKQVFPNWGSLRWQGPPAYANLRASQEFKEVLCMEKFRSTVGHRT